LGELSFGRADFGQDVGSPKIYIKIFLDMKRLIGKCQVDETIQNNKKYWTFEVKEEDEQPVVEIEQNGKKRLVKPEEVSALVLEKMKNAAEKVLLKKVTKAVITVPAYFNQAQKQGTIRAARMAGLEVVNLVTEPAAAAFAYGFDNNDYNDTNILVEDIGGGTFDVVVVKVKNGRFVVSAIGGDTELGGRDFDHLLMDYFNKEIKDKYGIDCYANKRTKYRLLKECIDVKIALSNANEFRYT
jgi:molecular chaperone DnaK (HSP70)